MHILLKKNADTVSDSSGSDSSGDSVRCTPIARVGGDGDKDGDSEQDVNHAVEMKLVDNVIADFTLRCTQLVYFSVIGKHTSSVLPLLQLNPNLCFVTLTSCPKVLRCIANLCPHIISITITEQATSTDLELFALNVLSKLTQLCLPDTPVGKRFLVQLLQRAPSLRELRLGVVRYDWADLQITCPNLVVFRCFFPLNVLKPELIANLSNVMPHVRTLILLCTSSASQGVVATMMTKILDSFPALRQLCSLQAFEDKIATLESSLAGQTHTSHSYALEELYLCNSGHSLSHSILQRCSALHTLGLGSATDGSAVMKYLPASVKRFICFSLHCVNARGYAIFKNLYELEIGGNCQQLTDSVLVNIAKNCPRLTLLRLNFSPRVTLKGALALLKLCPHLRSLEYHRASSNRNEEANEAVAAVMELRLLHYPHVFLFSLSCSFSDTRDFRNSGGFASYFSWFGDSKFTCVVSQTNCILMVNFVLVVPKQSLNALLVSWLSLSDVGRLDAALCDRACRETFEHSLSLRNFCGATDELFANSKFIIWVIKRKIKLDALRIGSNLLRSKNEKLRCEVLKVVGPTLRRAVINCGEDVQFNSEYFTENRNFRDSDDESDNDTIDDSDDETMFDPDRFYERDFDAKTDVEHAVERALMDDVILDLSMKCTKLEKFTVLGHHSGSVMSLLMANPKLTKVTMSSCPKVLRCIGKMCPDISSINIADQASLNDLAQFAQHVPTKLARLCLPNADVKSCFMLPVVERPSLVELRLGTVRFDWTLLTTSCPKMKIFRCTVPYDVDANGFIAQLAPIMPNLQTLILGQQDSYMSTTVLATVLENFPKLRQFCADLDYEDHLSTLPCSAGLAPPSQTARVPVLEELYVGNLLEYRNMFDMGKALQACPALYSVGFSGSRTDAMFRQCAAAGIVKIVNLKMHNTWQFDQMR